MPWYGCSRVTWNTCTSAWGLNTSTAIILVFAVRPTPVQFHGLPIKGMHLGRHTCGSKRIGRLIMPIVAHCFDSSQVLEFIPCGLTSCIANTWVPTNDCTAVCCTCSATLCLARPCSLVLPSRTWMSWCLRSGIATRNLHMHLCPHIYIYIKI